MRLSRLVLLASAAALPLLATDALAASGELGPDRPVEHRQLRLDAGINHECINAEVAKGQWEFQIFAKGAQEAHEAIRRARQQGKRVWGEPLIQHLTLDAENDFLAAMLAWEQAPVLPIYRWFDPELRPPRPAKTVNVPGCQRIPSPASHCRAPAQRPGTCHGPIRPPPVFLILWLPAEQTSFRATTSRLATPAPWDSTTMPSSVSPRATRH